MDRHIIPLTVSSILISKISLEIFKFKINLNWFHANFVLNSTLDSLFLEWVLNSNHTQIQNKIGIFCEIEVFIFLLLFVCVTCRVFGWLLRWKYYCVIYQDLLISLPYKFIMDSAMRYVCWISRNWMIHGVLYLYLTNSFISIEW